MTERSFHDIAFDSEADTLRLLYCAYMLTHPDITFSSFERAIKAKPKIMRRAMAQMISYNEVMAQFATEVEPHAIDTEQKPQTSPIMLGDVAARLVVAGGLDAHYVMRQMTIPDMLRYIKALDDKQHQELEAQRLWTYISLLPHVDKKQLPTPQKLYLFPWEVEEVERKAKAEIEKNKDMLERFISGELVDISKIQWNNGKQ